MASMVAIVSRLRASRGNSTLNVALDGDQQANGVERGQPQIVEVGAGRQMRRRNGKLHFAFDDLPNCAEHFPVSEAAFQTDGNIRRLAAARPCAGAHPNVS